MVAENINRNKSQQVTATTTDLGNWLIGKLLLYLG